MAVAIYNSRMTTKERLHKLVDELSETEADETLRIVIARREGKVVDEWGDVNEQTDLAARGVLHGLDEEERAAFGETIAEAWAYTRPK